MITYKSIIYSRLVSEIISTNILVSGNIMNLYAIIFNIQMYTISIKSYTTKQTSGRGYIVSQNTLFSLSPLVLYNGTIFTRTL